MSTQDNATDVAVVTTADVTDAARVSKHRKRSASISIVNERPAEERHHLVRSSLGSGRKSWPVHAEHDMPYAMSFGEALHALRRTEARLERVRLALWATRRGSLQEARRLREQSVLAARRRRLRRLLERIEAHR